MTGIVFYLGVFFISCVCLWLSTLPTRKSIYYKNNIFKKSQIFLFLFLVSPVILIYTIRYGIGTDYFAYRNIFDKLHNVSLQTYNRLHSSNIGEFYVEPGYFVLNRYLSFSYGSLLCLCSIIMLGLVYYGSICTAPKINLAFVVFIYFCTQFIYSMNGVRFAIALTIIFWGIQFIIRKNIVGWLFCIFLAMGFHKTSIICVPLFFCADFKNKHFNKIRDFLLYLFVLFFPLIVNWLLFIVSKMSIFSRYFSVGQYALGNFSFKPMFLFHIVPVFLPLLILKKKFILKDTIASVLFKISLFEIPLRELGSFNTWLTRLARFPQMIQLILVPYILFSIKNPKKRMFLKVYYILWYLFYFVYGTIVNDAGDSLPYQSIFSNGGNW